MKEHQKILQTLDVEKRLHMVNFHLAHEVEVLEIQNRINKQVQEELETACVIDLTANRSKSLQRLPGMLHALLWVPLK